MNNREYFANIFILLAVTTCSVIIIVKYSLALSLGLVGALSIVRFRAAIKEPEELVYLFLTIAFGLAFGANQFTVGFILLGVAIVVIFFLSKIIKHNSGFDNSGMLLILSGSRENILQLKNEHLVGLLDETRSAILKSYDLEELRGQLTLKCETSDESEKFLLSIESICQDLNLDLNMISDISVPA